MMSLSGQKKQELRRVALDRRESLCPSKIGSWGELIQDRALGHCTYRSATAIALYSPIGNEVPTHRICDHALASGRGVFYPKLSAVIESLVHIESEKDLLPGRYGILEPQGSGRMAGVYLASRPYVLWRQLLNAVLSLHLVAIFSVPVISVWHTDRQGESNLMLGRLFSYRVPCYF